MENTNAKPIEFRQDGLEFYAVNPITNEVYCLGNKDVMNWAKQNLAWARENISQGIYKTEIETIKDAMDYVRHFSSWRNMNGFDIFDITHYPIYTNRNLQLLYEKSDIENLLTEREQKVFEMRFPTNGKTKTFKEIAKILNICSATVSRDERNALRKLCHPRKNPMYKELTDLGLAF